MKNILTAFLLITITALPARADDTNYGDKAIAFSHSVVYTVLKSQVPADRQEIVAQVYVDNMNKETGTLSAAGMYKVCAAAGFDVATTQGYSQCKAFLNNLISESRRAQGQRYDVMTASLCEEKLNGVWTDTGCMGRDGYLLHFSVACNKPEDKRDKMEICDKQFFNLKSTGPVAMEFINAMGIKGIKDNSYLVTCMPGVQNIAKTGIQQLESRDHILCSARGIAYDFEFYSLNNTVGPLTLQSENEYLCKLYNGTVAGMDIRAGDAIDGTADKSVTYCSTDEKTCLEKIKPLAQTIGRKTIEYKDGRCEISRDYNPVHDIENLNKIAGVDSFIFADINTYSDIAKQSTEQYLKNILPNKTSYCDPQPRVLLKTNAIDNDYIISCHVDGTPVDFVYGDLSESAWWTAASGTAKSQCIVNGGKYKGHQCRGLDPSMCRAMSVKIKGGTHWDAATGQCVLNATQDAEFIDQVIITSIGTLVPFVGAASKVTTLVLVSGVALDVAFAGIERWKEIAPHSTATKFLNEAEKCNNADCAFDILVKYHADLSDSCESLPDGMCDDLNNDMLYSVLGALEKLTNLTGEEGAALAIKASGLSEGRRLQKAAFPALFLGTMIKNPTKAAKEFAEHSPMWVRALSRAAKNYDDVISVFARKYGAQLRHSSTLGGKQYFRIFINRTRANPDDIVADLQRNNFYVSSGMTEGNDQFIAFSREDIFGPWDNAQNNWMFGPTSKVEPLVQVEHMVTQGQKIGGKIGDELAVDLYRKFGGGQYNGTFYYWGTGAQCETGLKFHVSVAQQDLENASVIVNDVVKKHGVSGQWKVNVHGMGGKQVGKDFTIYVSPGNDNASRLKPFLQDLEQSLKRADIESNGVGQNILVGDRQVKGSQYINYRYDRVNNNGVPQSSYRSEYEFVAPNQQYGGDIMQNVSVY